MSSDFKNIVNMQVTRMESLNVAFSLDDIEAMISLFNGLRYGGLSKPGVANLLEKLNSLRDFAKGLTCDH